MWETREVTLAVRLPHDIADQAEEVHKADPEFLERVVLYGLTRRSIYHQLRSRDAGPLPRPPAEDTAGQYDRIQPIPEEEQGAILEENEERGLTRKRTRRRSSGRRASG